MANYHKSMTPAQRRARRAKRALIVAAVGCPDCAAQAGGKCYTAKGKLRSTPHIERVRSYRAETAKKTERMVMDVKPHQTWKHTNGNEYTVLHVTNTAVVREGHEPDVVYQGSNGSVWSRPLADWHRSFTIVRDRPSRGVVDEAMAKAKEFASSWSLVGSRFDDGTMLAETKARKAELRALLQAAALPAVPDALGDKLRKYAEGLAEYADVGVAGAVAHKIAKELLAMLAATPADALPAVPSVPEDAQVRRWADIARNGTPSDFGLEFDAIRKWFAATPALPAVPEGYVLVRRDSIERAAQMAEVFDDGSDGADAETAARVAHDLRGWLIAA